MGVDRSRLDAKDDPQFKSFTTRSMHWERPGAGSKLGAISYNGPAHREHCEAYGLSLKNFGNWCGRTSDARTLIHRKAQRVAIGYENPDAHDLRR